MRGSIKVLIKGLFRIIFEGPKSAFNTQKVHLQKKKKKKKVLVWKKKIIKALLRI